MADRSSDVSVVRVAQVGVRGFGYVHLGRIDRLAEMGRVELVATVDPGGPAEGRQVPAYESLTDLLARHEVDVVSIATPIGTHYALAAEAIAAGADVMLEKPPVASMADFERLCELAESSGRLVQIGFQSLGSAAVPRVRELGAQIGDLTSVQVLGTWQRNRAYYQRSPWAGKRSMNGVRVADGVCTNPLAHSFATAFALVGLTDIGQVASIETELYHAHPIEADDTSWVRVARTDGVPIDASLVLTAEAQADPTITLVGTKGNVTLAYTTDTITATLGDEEISETTERTDLLENLLDARDGTAGLLVPLPETAGFMGVLEASQVAPAPVQIDDAYVTWVGADDLAYPHVEMVEHWQRTSLDQGVGYLEAGAPWAREAARATWRPGQGS